MKDVLRSIKLRIRYGLAFSGLLISLQMLLATTPNSIYQLDHMQSLATTDIHQNMPTLRYASDELTETQAVVFPTLNASVYKTNQTGAEATGRRTYFNYGSFNYIYLPQNVCSSNGHALNPYLIIVVKSSVFQIGNREAIRSTWGKLEKYNIKLVFLLGYSPLVQAYINMEYKLHKDIVQQNFIDDYYNNTLKTIMAFHWTVTYCPNSEFVSFFDDDMFVNLPKLLQYIDLHSKKKTENLITGYKVSNLTPIRNKNSKWYISRKEYPHHFFPDYLAGGSFVMNMDTVKRFMKEIPYIKQIFIDDVYLGIVAKSLNVTLTNDKTFRFSIRDVNRHNLVSSHGYGSPHQLVSDWKLTTCDHFRLFQDMYKLQEC